MTADDYGPAEFDRQPDRHTMVTLPHIHISGRCAKDRRGDCPTRLEQAAAHRATVTGDFTRPCLDCAETVHTVDAVEQPHDCHPEVTPTEESRALVARAYWAGFDAGATRRPQTITRE